eukprot:500976-Pelagomonas_calceolata.AAC.2
MPCCNDPVAMPQGCAHGPAVSAFGNTHRPAATAPGNALLQHFCCNATVMRPWACCDCLGDALLQHHPQNFCCNATEMRLWPFCCNITGIRPWLCSNITGMRQWPFGCNITGTRPWPCCVQLQQPPGPEGLHTSSPRIASSRHSWPPAWRTRRASAA